MEIWVCIQTQRYGYQNIYHHNQLSLCYFKITQRLHWSAKERLLESAGIPAQTCSFYRLKFHFEFIDGNGNSHLGLTSKICHLAFRSEFSWNLALSNNEILQRWIYGQSIWDPTFPFLKRKSSQSLNHSTSCQCPCL